MSGTGKAVGLRRSVMDSKSRKKTGNGGWRGGWRDRMDIPKAEAADVLLTRGSYPNPEDLDKNGEPTYAHYHTCKMHHMKVGQSFSTARCAIDAALAAGKEESEADCLACYAQSEGNRAVSTKTSFSFNCLHIALHERVPVIDKDTKRPKKYEQGEKRGEVMTEWALVEKPRRRQEILDDVDALVEKGDVALFRKKYIECGAGHRDEISAIDEKASHLCICGGKLRPIRFTCSNCEEVLADVHENDMSPAEVLSFSSQREKCKFCKTIDLPVPESVCDSCRDPQPLTAFDVVATICKEGEGKGSHIVVQKIVPLDQYELPNGASLIEWENVAGKGEKARYEPVYDPDGNFTFTEDYDTKKTAEVTWDFEKVHTPRDHEWVANKLGCRVPSGFRPIDGGTSNKYRRYGGAAADSRTRVEDDGDVPEDNEPENEPAPRGRRRTEEPSPVGRRRQTTR